MSSVICLLIKFARAGRNNTFAHIHNAKVRRRDSVKLPKQREVSCLKFRQIINIRFCFLQLNSVAVAGMNIVYRFICYFVFCVYYFQMTRRRDRISGLHNVQYEVLSRLSILFIPLVFVKPIFLLVYSKCETFSLFSHVFLFILTYVRMYLLRCKKIT